MNMEKKPNLEEGFDRISDLPEPIRAHILSYLPTVDAVRAGILSNTWRALWVQVPFLDLSRCNLPKLVIVESLPNGDEDDASRFKRVSIMSKRESFYDFLDCALGSVLLLEILKLYVPGFGSELKCRLDNWLHRSVRYCLKELELAIGSSKDLRYRLPNCVFCSNSIRKLVLRNCEVNVSSLTDIQLPSLRDLCLEFVSISEEAMMCLFANCSNIENFVFKSCHGLESLQIYGLAKLDKVEVEHHFDEELAVKIEAPSLREFTYECLYEYEYLEEVTCEIELAGCQNLTYLKLVGAALEDFELHCLLKNIPGLERIDLSHCYCLRNVVISSQILIHLELIQCNNLRKAELNTPNLEFFHYDNDDPLSFWTKAAPLKLKEATVYLKPDMKNDKWYADLVKFLARLRYCENLTLNVCSEEDLIVPDNVRMKWGPPLSDVKHLVVKLRLSFLKHTPVKLVGSLLWLAPRPETLSVHNHFIPVCKLLKFMYERPLKCKKGCGCWTLPISCWRHSLCKVSIENQEGGEDDAELANFLCNGRIDVKVVCSVNNAPFNH